MVPGSYERNQHTPLNELIINTGVTFCALMERAIEGPDESGSVKLQRQIECVGSTPCLAAADDA